jgi:uncharacterized membrane protein
VTADPRRFGALAWLTGLLPLVASHAAYLISASLEAVPWCVPHLEGCTSISRAARSTGPAIVVYKSLVLPYSVLVGLFWWRTATWLREVRPERRKTIRALPVLGLVAAIGTASYTAVLGVDGDVIQFIRRYAINVGFGFTILAELLLTAALAQEPRVPEALRRAMVGMCAAMLLLGLASIPLQFLTGSHGEALNAIEWTYGVLLLSFFPVIGAAARRSALSPIPS